MKNLIPLLLIPLFLMNCQTEDLVVNQDLTIDAEASAAFNDNAFPKVIPLPTDFAPEGIVTGRGTDFYVGSLAEGAIYKGNYRTGAGSILVPQQVGKIAVGLAYDGRTNYLYVAAGRTGMAYVYNAATGAQIAIISLTTSSTTFINDCIVTKDAVYFTDSFTKVFYRVSLLNNGRLPDPISADEIPLSGDFTDIPSAFNSNGIVATPDGEKLIIGNTSAGYLYLVDPSTGVSDEIDLGGEQLPNNDGLVLLGKTLYVVQNRLNQISVLELSTDYASGAVIDVITDDDFDIPTTAALFGNRLYAVNARFGVSGPDVEYDVVGVPAK